ncbi:MAG: hypothetical protein ACTS6G_01190, partial [Candidatus Hodgkinia cicadicola]
PCTSSLSPFDRRLPTFVLGSFGGSLYWTRQVSLRLRSPIESAEACSKRHLNALSSLRRLFIRYGRNL